MRPRSVNLTNLISNECDALPVMQNKQVYKNSSKVYLQIVYLLHKIVFSGNYYCKSQKKTNKLKAVDYINYKKLQRNNKNFLITFSGGQDSITLLVLLFGIQSQNLLKLNLLWNHHLWHKDSFFITRHIFKLSFLFKTTAHNAIYLSTNQSQRFRFASYALIWQCFITKKLGSKTAAVEQDSSSALKSMVFPSMRKAKLFPRSAIRTSFYLQSNKSSICKTEAPSSSRASACGILQTTSGKPRVEALPLVVRRMPQVDQTCKGTALRSKVAATSIKSELQARQWRLRTSRRLKDFYRYETVMQAHSGTDKIETLLLNLFRGTGNISPFYLSDFRSYLSQTEKRRLFFD